MTLWQNYYEYNSTIRVDTAVVHNLVEAPLAPSNRPLVFVFHSERPHALMTPQDDDEPKAALIALISRCARALCLYIWTTDRKVRADYRLITGIIPRLTQCHSRHNTRIR